MTEAACAGMIRSRTPSANGVRTIIDRYALPNRGVLLTPFHNMALMSPATTHDDVARHHEIFEAALGELRP